jgi:hypothetical protein
MNRPGSRDAFALVLTLVATLVGCSALDPYPAQPRSPQPGAQPGPRVGICYNTLTTSLAQVEAEAQQECGANTLAVPVDTDWYLQACPLLLPARATFACAPGAK